MALKVKEPGHLARAPQLLAAYLTTA